jgi:microcystin-dependent protein
MADPFISEIRMFSFPFAPKWWAQCNGQLLPIAQNQALFSLLGTQYGGNGSTNFALPDLRGRAPMSFGNGTVQGEAAGVENVTLLSSQMPPHTHQAVGVTDTANSRNYDGAQFTAATNFVTQQPTNVYGVAVAMVPLGSSMTATGGSQPHNNMQPSLVVNFCIATVGVFPSRS